MEKTFWQQRWETNDIPFHEQGSNRLLVKYFDRLELAKGARVFVPLCGKTIDISWLLAHGYSVAGAELSEIAVRQLFEEMGIKPTITKTGKLERYSARNIDIFLGDIFDVQGDMLGTIDAVYDRAALVALPEDMRKKYTAHLMAVTHKAPQLLICYHYNQNELPGPPFSVNADEVKQHYAKTYDAQLLESADIKGGLKGKCAATENMWLLKPCAV